MDPATSHTELPLGGEIDVALAKSEFSELSRQLSRRSHSASASTINCEPGELEKGAASDDAFDFREYLTSSNDANQRAGIKHKVSDVALIPLALI